MTEERKDSATDVLKKMGLQPPAKPNQPVTEDDSKPGLGRAKKILSDALEVKVMRDALADRPAPTPPVQSVVGPGEKIGLDVGAMFAALLQTVQSKDAAIAALMQRSPSAAEDPMVQHLKEELGELKADIKANIKTQPDDPITYFLGTRDKMEKLADVFKPKEMTGLGIPGSIDFSTAIKLKELDFQLLDRKIQHEDEMEEKRQQRAFEWEKHKVDTDLKRMELQDNRKAKGRAGETFEDLGGALIDALAKGKNRGAVAAEVEEPQILTPRVMRCENCGTEIHVDKPGTPKVICPNPECKTEYELVLKD